MRLLTTALLVLPLTSFASVSLDSQSYKVVTTQQEDGTATEEWLEADKITPGDTVGYRVSYVNSGEQPATNVVISNPVPDNTVYIANSANGANSSITFSVDGSQYGPMNKLKVDEDGKTRPAAATDIKSIRWNIDAPIMPSTSGNIEFQVRVK